MKRVYCCIWSNIFANWIATPEQRKSKKLFATSLLLCSTSSWALPTSDTLVAGNATVSTPNTGQMQINQASQNAIINWQGFSISPNEAVNIEQPNTQAALLNRVIGQDASQIQGQLNANGQVYLVNPNGVIFGKTAQVDVGGLVASTHNISNADFMAGKNHFTQDSANGTVENYGTINSQNGGVVALIAESVTNTGAINTPKGTTALVAGKTVDLDFTGDGLVEVKVSEATLNALVTNKGAIQADAGRVVLTAKAAGQLIDTVINQQGIIKAQGLIERNGEIILNGGDNGTVKVSGTLDASAPQNGDGGFIDTSAAHVTIADTAKITTKANNGKTGSWIIDPVDFTIAASGGDMTGTALSASLSNTGITIFSTSGASGINGDINVNDVVNWSANTLTLNAQRNINVNTNLNGSGTAKLALQYGQANTGGDYLFNNGATINLSVGINFSTQKGTAGAVTNYNVINNLTNLQAINSGLGLNYALTSNIDASSTSGWNAGAGFVPIGSGAIPFTGNFDGLGHVIINLTINRPTTDNVGLFGFTESTSTISNIGLLGGNIAGQYQVGALVGSNLGSINNVYAVNNVTGTFSNVGGLVGLNDIGGSINNAYAKGNVSGTDVIGGLAGNNSGSISNAYATGNVSGMAATFTLVGGLVGDNSGTINTAYATGTANGIDRVGGLLGNNDGTVLNAYATGSASGTSNIGGLAGTNNNSIENTYATGKVTGTSNVGGLVGNNFNTILNSFWDTPSTTQNKGVGSGNTIGTTGVSTAAMKQFATFNNAGWNISNIGGSSAVWRIYEGNTLPLLRYWLKPLIINANISEPYNGFIHNSLINASYSIAGAASSGHLFYTIDPFGNAINIGAYPLTGQLYSDQQGYDITLILPSVLTITAIPPVIAPVITPEITPETSPVFTPVLTPEILPIVTQAVIQLNPFNFTNWQSQLVPLQTATTFLQGYQDKLIQPEEVDYDFGQYMRDAYQLTAVTYQDRRNFGKRHWSEKQKEPDIKRYARMLITIENHGMKLPKGLKSKL
jgi:filamentous hemagglutinin family protein